MISQARCSGSRGSRVSRGVFVMTGGMLIIAGLLKTINFAQYPSAGSPLLPTRFFGVAGIAMEFILGVWLLSGLFAEASRLLAVLAFAVFGAVSIDRGLSGETSCGCFGGLVVTPWATAALDLTVIVLLVAFDVPSLPPLRARRQRATLAAVSLLTLAIPLAWLVMQEPRPDQLTVVPASVELGTLPRGGRTTTFVTVYNVTSDDLEIAEVRVTCPCVSVIPDRWAIEAGKQLQLTIVLDLGEEPGFGGSLTIPVTAVSSAGQSVLHFTIIVNVDG